MDHAREKRGLFGLQEQYYFYVFLVTLVLASLITRMQEKNRGIFASSSSMKMEEANHLLRPGQHLCSSEFERQESRTEGGKQQQFCLRLRQHHLFLQIEKN
jgi:hypothetical protein